MKHIDLEIIDGCETAFNHHIGRIKIALDGIPGKENRLNQWRFACGFIAFLEKLTGYGVQGMRVAFPLFEKFTKQVRHLLEKES